MISSWFARVLVGTVVRLPPRGLGWLADRLGQLAYLLGIRREVTLDNLRLALPTTTDGERRRIARAAYANMSRAFLEGLTAPRLSDEQVQARVKVSGWELFERALGEGRGVLVATAHFGGWELLGEVMARRGVPLHAVVRPLRGALNAELVRSRARSGIQFIPPRGALRQTLAVLKRGEVVVMLIDQVLPAEHGVFVPFFGRPACTNPALSWAALRTGAPVLVAMGAREGEGLHLFVEGPFPVPAGERDGAVTEHTATLTSHLEGYIRRYPDQWLWLHRRWKVQPPPVAPALHTQTQAHP